MKKKILVVDDNRMILKFLENLLAAEGHEVKTREDGLSALNLLATYKPDVMFVDLIIPKIGGDRLCQIVRTMEHMKSCYLVIISAAIAEVKLNFKEIGVNACIAKGPFGNMGKHVLAAVRDSDDPSKFSERNDILGVSAMDGIPVYARRMTRELLGRNRHLETILESMNEGILEIYTDRVVYANSAAMTLFGVPLESLLSSRFVDLFDDAGLQKRMNGLLHPTPGAPSAVGVNFPIEFNNRRISIRSFPVKDDADTIILLVTDVTAEQELEYQLQHVRRMDAIGNLTGGIAHNFNNLLMGIQGNVSILIQDKKPGDPGYEELSGIERCIDSGAKLTRQLLNFSRGGRYSMARIDINDVVEKSATMFSRTRKEINVVTRLMNTVIVEADASQIELALMDLYVNAWHAMSGGGTLTVSTDAVALDENFVKPYHLPPGVYQKIEVADNGAGMDEKTAERIFDPFYTTRPIGEGTGLGLTSVFGVVKKHRGIITVETRLGQGTTFSIYLPKADTVAPAAVIMEKDADKTDDPQQNDVASELKKGSGTVLVVDDEEYILKADRAMLLELGYDVLIARGGKEGIAVFDANKDRIRLVILDLIMPDLGGDAIRHHIKSVRPDIRVILSSGYNIEGKAGMVLKESGDGFLQKPYNIKQFSEKIQEVLSDG